MGGTNSAGSYRKCFLSTCWSTCRFTLLRVTWQPFGWIFLRCFSWTPRGRTAQSGLWFRRAFIIVTCIQSLTTASRNCLDFIVACGLRMLYTLKELESPQFIRYSTIFFFVHFMVFLRMEQHIKELIRTVNAFHVGTVFLHAGRFYNILSRFSCGRDRSVMNCWCSDKLLVFPC